MKPDGARLISGWLGMSVFVLAACSPIVTTHDTVSSTETVQPKEPTPTSVSATETAAISTPTVPPTETPTAMPEPEEYVVFSRCVQDYCHDINIIFADPHGTVVRQLDIFKPEQSLGYDIFDIIPSPDGSYLAVKVLWSLESGGLRGGLHWVDLKQDLAFRIPVESYGPASWAPDSQHFAFMDAGAIFIWDITTHDLHKVFEDPAGLSAPMWSPDGRYLAFACRKKQVVSDVRWRLASLCLIQPDGSGLQIVAENVFVQGRDPNADFEGDRQYLDWSPDSQWLVYVSGTDQPDISIVNIATREVRLLAVSPGKDVNPDWSPDGRRIAFASNRNGRDEIFVIDADGSNLASLTPNPQVDNYSPIWSPSGQHLAFLISSGGRDELGIMSADGNERVIVGWYPMLFQRRPAWITSLEP